ncbi:MAG: ketoacyl-ACP synthase III [Candidatus Accumulibacter sp.]|jgi:3-oxoacyl-[acyl-carrier-protein] synthase-3|nr:ketoacyl-ACP synthase III [Accumulibacter sp.]
MAYLEFDNVRIAALTCAVPSYVQKIGADKTPDPAYVRNFQKQTGISQRHISITEQTSTDFAYAAALRAMEKTGWDAESIDAIVFMSQLPDYNPATGNACLMQYRLGLPSGTLAFDITLGCSSFPYGLSVCAAFLQQAHVNRVLMFSGETIWPQYASREELLRQDSFLFGEGSTALLLEKSECTSLSVSLHTDGSGYKHMLAPFGGARNAWRYQPKVLLPNGAEYSGLGAYMDGLEITLFATTTVVDSIRAFVSTQKKTLVDYDALVLHQANLQIVSAIAKRLKIDMDKVPVSLDRYGNMGGASVSLTIADAFANAEKNKLSLLTCGFGIGLSWGIAAFEIDSSVIDPIFTYDGRFEEGFVKPVNE